MLVWLYPAPPPSIPSSQALQSRLSSVEEELASAKRDCTQALTEKERSVHECPPHHTHLHARPAPPRLMRDATDVNGAHTTAVASLRQQLAAAEQAVVEEEASASRMQVRGICACPTTFQYSHSFVLCVYQSLVHTLLHWWVVGWQTSCSGWRGVVDQEGEG